MVNLDKICLKIFVFVRNVFKCCLLYNYVFYIICYEDVL